MIDKDLKFLSTCSNEQLKGLVDILVFDKDGKKRYTEQLSSTQKFSECYPNNLTDLVPSIINEIQLFGGNTIMNKLRGHGVPYRTILEDVCDKLKVNYNHNQATNIVETELLRKVALTAVEKLSDEDLKKIDENLNANNVLIAIQNDKGAVMMTIIAIIVAQITKQAAVEGGLVLFGRVLAPRLVALAVPFVNVLAALWAIFDIASPAYRITVPFVITASFIRRQQDTQCNLNKLFA